MENCAFQKNQLYNLEIIDSALPDGWGVARYNNFIVFVPDTLPGDKVTAKITKLKTNFAYAELVSITHKSPFAATVNCTNKTSLCGGCLFINFDYDKQLELKKKHLLANLKKTGETVFCRTENIEIIPSPDIFFYRNKMELSFGEKNGNLIIGLMEKVSPFKNFEGNVQKLKDCPIFSPHLPEIIDFFAGELGKLNLKPYNIVTGKGFLRNLVVRESKNTGEIMVILSAAKGDIPEIKNIADNLFNNIARIKSFYFVENNNPGNLFVYDKIKYIHGSRSIEEKIENLKFQIYPDTFFQPNTKMAQIIYGNIAGIMLKRNLEKPAGLYCGSAALEIYLAKFLKSVTGIDSNAKNIRAAIENSKINNIQNANFKTAKVENLLPSDLNPKNYDSIIADPPRSGLSPKAINLLAKSGLAHIIYLSCNNATFCRDIKSLKTSGFEVKNILTFDQFPHTGHLETLAVLER